MLRSMLLRLNLSHHLHSSSANGAKAMQAWQAFEFNGPEALHLNPSTSIPMLTNPIDVLVKVHASSVNPIDLRMLEGYGSRTFGLMRQLQTLLKPSPEFPLIPGRDFSGTIVHTGKAVKSFSCRDEVWGTLSPWQDGSHSQYVIASACSISKKPTSLDHVSASSIPYAALTAWSALSTFGGLNEKNAYRKKVLVTGATGGVGTLAIQLLKAWGAEVSVICQSDALDMMLNLGADTVIDYKNPEFRNNLKELNGLDLIFDNVGGDYPELTVDLLKKWSNSKYITVVSPLLKNVDDKGILFGSFTSAVQASLDTAMSLKDGRSFRWAYFIPNGCALKTIAKMVDQKQITPVVEKVYKFENVPDAYRKCNLGHSRGKTVIDHITQQTEDAELVNENKQHEKE